MKIFTTGFYCTVLASFVMGGSAKVYSQDEERQIEEDQGLEEIVVTGRKREESLQDVPVTVDVISAEIMDEAGINDLYDLFGLVAGIDFEDPNGDRNGANPAIRGVQAGGTGANIVNRRANSFLDGMPLTGQQGTIRFIDTEALEVYQGPQSAAFGRSTFTGAINYVSADPAPDFEGEVNLQTSNFGRNQITLSASGPITDTLGFTFDGEKSEYAGPDEWRTSEGDEPGSTSTDYFSGKLVWTPTEWFDAEVRYLNGSTDDGPSTRYVLSDEQLRTCDNFGTLSNGRIYILGEFDCDLGTEFTIPTNSSVELPQEAIDAFNNGEITQEQLDGFQAFADSYSIPGGARVTNDRERLSSELTFSFDESLLQVLAFVAEEESIVWTDADLTNDPLVYETVDMMGNPLDTPELSVPMGVTGTLTHMANPNTVEEEYLEVRWVSPNASRLRWMVGASYYDYAYEQENYTQYNAILNPELQEFPEVGTIIPTSITNQLATNTGVFFNLTYDIFDLTTLSIEGRWQRDEISNLNNLAEDYILENGLDNDLGIETSFVTGVTNSFLPRVALNRAFLDQKLTGYIQFAVGKNPGGANPEWLSPETIRAFQLVKQGIENGTIGPDVVGITGSSAEAERFVEFINTVEQDTYLTYEEEQIVNYEIGLKGDLYDGDLSFATALYLQRWTNMRDGANINFDPTDFVADDNEVFEDFANGDFSPSANGNGGDSDLIGWDTALQWRLNREWSARGTLSVHNNEYIDFCDVGAEGLGFSNNRFAGVDNVDQDCRQSDGNYISRTPALSGSLSLTYRKPLNNGLTLSVRGDARYTGEQFSDNQNILIIPQTTTFNLNVALSNRTWNLTAYVNNLLDDDTPRQVRFNNITLEDVDTGEAFPGGLTFDGNFVADLNAAAVERAELNDVFDLSVTPQTPREIGLRLRYNF